MSQTSYDPDSLIWACEIYTDLGKLKEESDALLATLKGKTLSPAQQSTVDKAKQFYDRYDYLDSYRLLKSIGA